MEDGRIPKDILYGELVTGRRPVGRPALRFRDVCKRDMKCTDSDPASWEQLAADRSEWRHTVKRGAHPGKRCPRAHFPIVFAMPARCHCAQCVPVRPVRTSAYQCAHCVPVRPLRTTITKPPANALGYTAPALTQPDTTASERAADTVRRITTDNASRIWRDTPDLQSE
ncbi:hypothetical protein Bbelb_254660 [Branchiostoma belcheri]|nr:hypothetical protein Bbelb_254660 [Branchiostoma belcheri]